MHTITTTVHGPLDVEATCTCGETEHGESAAAWAELHLLLTAPEPTLPCPDWCQHDACHGWDSADVDEPTVHRTHRVVLGEVLTVRVERFDTLDLATMTETAGTSTLTVDVEGAAGSTARAVYEAVRAAARLVARDAR